MSSIIPLRRDAAADEPVPLIFDPESLLLDPRAGIEYSLAHAMSELGIDVPRGWFEHQWSPRMSFHEALARLMDTEDPERIGEGYVRYFAHYNESGRFRCELRSGAMQLLAQLTGDNRFRLHYLTHIGAQAASRLLDTYGLQHLPHSIVTPETPGCPGLRPPLLRHSVDSSGEAEPRWVLLSDHPWELMAAQRLRVRTVALAYGRASLPVLCRSQPDAIAASVLDVREGLLELVQGPRAALSWPQPAVLHIH